MTEQEAQETARVWLEGNRLSVKHNQRYLANMILTVDANARKDLAEARRLLREALGHVEMKHTGGTEGCKGCELLDAARAFLAGGAFPDGARAGLCKLAAGSIQANVRKGPSDVDSPVSPAAGTGGAVMRVGVAAIPNRCSICGKFKPWGELITHFVPDSDYSSEDESWRECKDCRAARSLEGR